MGSLRNGAGVHNELLQAVVKHWYDVNVTVYRSFSGYFLTELCSLMIKIGRDSISQADAPPQPRLT